MHAPLAEVDAECARTLAEAEARAHELAREGRREGSAQRRQEARAATSRRRRGGPARSGSEAQRRQFEELRARDRGRLSCGLRDDRRYPELLDRLARAARDRLGADAELELDPPAPAA